MKIEVTGPQIIVIEVETEDEEVVQEIREAIEKFLGLAPFGSIVRTFYDVESYDEDSEVGC